VSALQRRLTASLRDAMRARDSVAVAVLRSVLGEVGNAEAVPVDERSVPRVPVDGSLIAGSVSGAGAGDVARRELTDDDVAAIVRAEAADRRRSAEEYRSFGRDAEATSLDAEASVLDALLDAPSDG